MISYHVRGAYGCPLRSFVRALTIQCPPFRAISSSCGTVKSAGHTHKIARTFYENLSYRAVLLVQTLSIVQPGVQPMLVIQREWTPHLDDAPVLDDDDAVGGLDRR